MKISEQPPLQIVKTDSLASTKPAPQAESGAPLLLATPGQLVKGRVIELLTDGKVLLEVGGQLVTARSLVPLPAGAELWLETGQDVTGSWLTLAAKKGAVQELLKLLVAGAVLSDSDARELADLFTSPAVKLAPLMAAEARAMVGSTLASTAGGEPDPAAVRLLVQLLGRAAGQSKGLLELLDRLPAKQLLQNQHLTASADKMAKLLAAHQEINSQPPPANSQNYFLFPCFFVGTSGWGEWLFSMEQQPAADQVEHYSLSFFLSMSRLGQLVLQATIRGRQISGSFQLETEAARRYLEANIIELVQLLERQGYRQVSLVCRVARGNIFSSLKEALAEKANIKRFSLLDVSA